MTRSRLRLVVVQVMILSLFATLLARLFYLQVVSGDTYRTAAAAQTLRQVVIPAPRGLIVDDQGRPLVANRSAWVISVDRTLLNKLSAQQQKTVLTRVAGVVGQTYGQVLARTQLCTDPKANQTTCWSGPSVQPIPIASNVSAGVATEILERNEDFPSILAQTQTVRAYPSPYGVNAALVLGYLSQITQGELDQALKTKDKSLTAASLVGRSGLEQQYDQYLRGLPGYEQMAVNFAGQVLGQGQDISPTPGDTLVTSLDARVQAIAEKELATSIAKARKTFDKVTGRNYVADSGAVVVMDAHNGRVVAMASSPTYNPNIWVGGISQKNLNKLYSAKANDPLLSRATQGQYAPGSTFKPLETVAALNHGLSTSTLYDCSSSLNVGGHIFGNFESESFGPITFQKALQVSCDTFFYQVGLHFYNKYGSNPANVKAFDPLVNMAKSFGYGKPTGIDLPGEAPGRIADRRWKLDYWKQMKGYYCTMAKKGNAPNSFLRAFAPEFCSAGYLYNPGDAANFSIGQGDTLVTPLQMARAYAAIANGGTLYQPSIGRAIVSPSGKVIKSLAPVVSGHIPSTKAALKYVDQALGTTLLPGGTLAWKFGGFPLDKVQLHGKTGTAEVVGKQTTGWVATYTKDYVVVMMISQGGTGSGSSGDAIRAIWNALYGINGTTNQVNRANAVIPGVLLPNSLPIFTGDGSVLPPALPERKKS
ncbi:MAG: penicillin-binding protein 2 [Marmoricola sp.]